jgi:hypothetical protein
MIKQTVSTETDSIVRPCVMVAGLAPGASVRLRVCAANSVGRGPHSDPRTFSVWPLYGHCLTRYHSMLSCLYHLRQYGHCMVMHAPIAAPLNNVVVPKCLAILLGSPAAARAA